MYVCYIHIPMENAFLFDPRKNPRSDPFRWDPPTFYVRCQANELFVASVAS